MLLFIHSAIPHGIDYTRGFMSKTNDLLILTLGLRRSKLMAKIAAYADNSLEILQAELAEVEAKIVEIEQIRASESELLEKE